MSFTSPIPIQSATAPGLALDRDWHRKSVFYEVMVRSFVDSNGDGFGDFTGLTSKLDYLQWLGVDGIWVPPFYQSPLRDGGYDVSDFTAVLPEYGTIDDFRHFVAEAHARNMRVMIDLPINHTSDQHPWFLASREDPEGPYGDFYVWRDDDTGYPNVRIIFVDTEESNWAFDAVRRQFFWHRFFSHQPDLNYENPAVHEAIEDVLRFWLDMGVDGIRLDAIPYLYESEDGNGESEPATHEYIQKLRRIVDDEYPGRVLIAEANQWPAETAAYFGTAEEPECHMAFDFPTMPRIFYSLRAQNSLELKRILAEQVEVPPGSAWGVFLRNHDELTLEMVSEEYRQAMYGWYAYDPRMRSNVGIRRRLASLLDNSRAELELANALLFSLPGSPFLYYGDEIGMGDNIWLDDRDASRTPMQWTPDRNAGFSAADPGKLFLPVVQSLVYHYAAVNVESQMTQASSLLNWMRSVLHVRRAHPVFGLGDITVLDTDNDAVLAFVRSYEGDGSYGGPRAEQVLCVFSFSHNPVHVSIDAPQFAGARLHDLFGGGEFPTIAEDGRFSLTFGTQSFYWLGISPS